MTTTGHETAACMPYSPAITNARRLGTSEQFEFDDEEDSDDDLVCLVNMYRTPNQRQP